MKLIKITKVDKSVYEIVYKNFWNQLVTKRIYPYLFCWRWSENGKEVPFFISTSIGNIAKDLNVNETKYFNS